MLGSDARQRDSATACLIAASSCAASARSLASFAACCAAAAWRRRRSRHRLGGLRRLRLGDGALASKCGSPRRRSGASRRPPAQASPRAAGLLAAPRWAGGPGLAGRIPRALHCRRWTDLAAAWRARSYRSQARSGRFRSGGRHRTDRGRRGLRPAAGSRPAVAPDSAGCFCSSSSMLALKGLVRASGPRPAAPRRPSWRPWSSPSVFLAPFCAALSLPSLPSGSSRPFGLGRLSVRRMRIEVGGNLRQRLLVGRVDQPHDQEERHHRRHEVGVGDLPHAAVVAALVRRSPGGG